MIEVEQKFILSEYDIARLTEGAEFLGEKEFTDVYWDTDEYALTKNDMWLRNRSGQWELKIPRHQFGQGMSMQQYEEIEGEEKIREIFAIARQKDFASDIAGFGYAPFCECTTKRKKYKQGEFIIDLDNVDYGDFNYAIGEIELMVDGKEEMNEAADRIRRFAEEKGLKSEIVRGKIIEYLFNKKPEHYQALVEAGVVKE
ncbi:MAG TPA: CYTH domain-containing protein [Patescibacteria group bacterium]